MALRLVLGVALLAPAAGPRLVAAPQEGSIVFQSEGLRIYRGRDRNGGAALILTNLDAEGNFLPGRGETPESSSPVAPAPRDTARGPSDPATGAAPVIITVRELDGTKRPAGEAEVEVKSDGSGSTSIVININNNPPPPLEKQPASAFLYPVVAFGGLPGPIRYPDHQHFLGYGHGVGSPSWFGGLGPNAGNRFGLKTSDSCERDYDCMFGPGTLHPWSAT